VNILLLHPEDSPRRGPWSAERWDLLVDLGRSSAPQVEDWKKTSGSEVLGIDNFRRGIADWHRVRDILFAGRGRVVDSACLDWWELNGIEFHEDLYAVQLLRRLSAELPASGKLCATRPCWQAQAIAQFTGRTVDPYAGHQAARWSRYRKAARRLTAAQLLDVVFDKHDPSYTVRRRISRPPKPGLHPQVLVPSAYVNVSRAAADYARLLPRQSFLLAATRNSALQADLPPNMRTLNLAAYARGKEDAAEREHLTQAWLSLRADLAAFPEVAVLQTLGRLDAFATLLRQGLALRDAWLALLAREPVCAVLCGDDSNPPTRIPVSLARMKGIPTADFHHGAFDGRFLFKTLPADYYLAKSAMEYDYLVNTCGKDAARIRLGASRTELDNRPDPAGRNGRVRHIVLFSEPYEVGGSRADEVYRELLPLLAVVARREGVQLLIKLHPFESLRERRRLVAGLISPQDARVSVVSDVPVADVLRDAYCALTIESSTVLECAARGVPCFLCGWRELSSFGYARQYAKCGVGLVLKSPGEICCIPQIIASAPIASASVETTTPPAAEEVLSRLFALTAH
jgi:hypothetical protein